MYADEKLYRIVARIKKISPAVATGATATQLDGQTKKTSSCFASSIPKCFGDLRTLQLSSIAVFQTIVIERKLQFASDAKPLIIRA